MSAAVVPGSDAGPAGEAARNVRVPLPDAGGTDVVVSHRRPYRKEVTRTWFLARPAYRAYALREFSSVIVGLFVFDLMVGLVAVNRGADAWAWWVHLQTSPANLVLTVFALVMSLVHAATWFKATPKIIKIRRGTHYLPDRWVIAQHYLLLLLFGGIVYVWLGGL